LRRAEEDIFPEVPLTQNFNNGSRFHIGSFREGHRFVEVRSKCPPGGIKGVHAV